MLSSDWMIISLWRFSIWSCVKCEKQKANKQKQTNKQNLKASWCGELQKKLSWIKVPRTWNNRQVLKVFWFEQTCCFSPKWLAGFRELITLGPKLNPHFKITLSFKKYSWEILMSERMRYALIYSALKCSKTERPYIGIKLDFHYLKWILRL